MAMTTTFQLPPPPRFRGLHPDLPITRYERNLPHWRQGGATYFVTFRLADALPQSKLRMLRTLRADWERTYPSPRSEEDWLAYARQVTTAVEHWLDEGYGACHFRDPQWCHVLRQWLEYFQDQRCWIGCWAMMPNHCHAVIQPLGNYSLEKLLGAIKGVTARHMNIALNSGGALWQDECFDRIVRDEEHLLRVIQYIGRNPRMAGLAHEESRRRWIAPCWEAAGWGFRDTPP